ncbi:Glutamate--tRNA ligase 1 [Paraconexibacter sp. AEG42_29]|uniref:Glutamyl-Q tRNA(Asp) synthetase n=1 Tax=Paraconexibacter sp. AEG42_29 TaxID=2997339 RepID=A0AAU7AXS5_9ACTN
MVGRYAPSPSGDLHLGNLRTALVAWLMARSAGSPFLVRVEDLDRGRSREHFVATQLEDLAALGLDHDGPVMRQSERAPRYDEALARLGRDDRLYECFCTRAEIRQAASAPHGDGPEGAYPGTCRHLSSAARTTHLEAGRRPALRVRADDASFAIEDRLAGTVTATIDDFVVRRADGEHAYNLAVVVDDADQGVQEVVRGDDLLSTTPRQAWLATQLNLTPPASYVHVPLVLGPDGTRLAKRHGAVTLRELLAAGWTDADVLTFIARSIGVDGTPQSAADLVAAWDLAQLPRDPVTLDPATALPPR